MDNRKRNQTAEILLGAILGVALVHLLFMLVSGKGLLDDNDYNSYTLQTKAWLEGRLDLGQDYSWLELAIYEGKYFVSFPPFPSYLMLLPSLLFPGVNMDQLVPLLLLFVGVVYSTGIVLELKLNRFYALLLPVFLYCGTNLLQVTVDGWVWFFAQNAAVTFTLMSFYYALKGKKGRSFFFLCCGFGCRPFQVLYLPLLILLVYRKTEEKTVWSGLKKLFFHRFYVYIPGLLLVGSYLCLNYFRFGSLFEFGHNYLPEFVRSHEGQFSLSYLPKNLPCLLRLPEINPETGAVQLVGFDGINVFLVYPILLFLLLLVLVRWYERQWGKGEGLLFVLTVGLVLLHIACLLLHKTMGGFHFGNRYIADTMPAVYVLTAFFAAGRKEGRIGKTEGVFLLLLGFGILINFVGTLSFYNT